MHTVELLADTSTEERVRHIWQRLADAGLPSLASHPHPTNRPHVTLATTPELPWAVRRELCAAFTVLPLPLSLRGVIRFSGRVKVLAWRVVPDAALAALQRQVWEVLAGYGTGEGNSLHEPGNWVPHISLARARSGAVPWPDELLPAELSQHWDGTFEGARSYDSTARTVEPLT
ncbi:2'-5' RNA ligase family protein [Streptomyces sp. NPDC096032]|uniref:2'-5' RNA ligase family protein n=1 Tax=Streptomyces sp. NPDC096032 TaxID=3366070 RepID=UPI00380D1208